MYSGPAIVTRAGGCLARRALIVPEGTFTYEGLLESSARFAAGLLSGAADLSEERVAFLFPPGAGYVQAQWAIWRAGGVAVPLAPSQAPAEWEYIVRDTGAAIVVSSPEFGDRVEPVARGYGARLVVAEAQRGSGAATANRDMAPLPPIDPSRRAMIIYTSGTTSRPKGVVTTHAAVESQITTLVDAWGWTADDHALHVLPLNHVHGIVNVLGCALWAGATCEILPRFDAAEVWRRLASGDVTVFMAVPTIYVKLLSHWDGLPVPDQLTLSKGASSLRLMVSGSAALPVRVLERWREVTGHVLLERYGMTEVGMALSNPLRGERRPGSVGMPLPGVEVRLVNDDGTLAAPGQPGEIEVRGPSVFLEYWGRPEETRAAFRAGWFRTGDVAVAEAGMYRILGRRSVDIIKTGGYKVSALEIEEVLRSHPAVKDCAVVGVEDDVWGERVAAAVVEAEGERLDIAELAEWASARIAPYKVPSRMLVVGELPRNAIGKVTKPDVTKLFTPPR